MTDQAVTDQRRAEPPRAGTTPGGRFLGRTGELARLHADVAHAGLSTLSGRPAPHARVLLVAGAPGTGRTALAEEFAARLAGEYPDGVLRVRLGEPGARAVPVECAARHLLRALPAPPEVPPGADAGELTAVLRGALAGRRAILLLDDVADAEQVLDLLPDHRGCLVLAVSSGPLTGVPEVRPCVVGGLDRAASVTLLGRHAGTTARLSADPRTAEVLAEACGDLPSALQLLGTWLADRPSLPLAEALHRLTGQSAAPLLPAPPTPAPPTPVPPMPPAPPPAGSTSLAEDTGPADGTPDAPPVSPAPVSRPEGAATGGAAVSPAPPPSAVPETAGHAVLPRDRDTDDGPRSPAEGDEQPGADGDGTAPQVPGGRRPGESPRYAPPGPAPAGRRAAPAGAARRVPAGRGPDPVDPLARVLRLVHASMPASSARMLRLLALAPGGHVDAHDASALAGCSVPVAGATLADFARLGLLQPANSLSEEGGWQLPGWLAPMLAALLETHERPAETTLARARMLERVVRRLQACRAVTEPDDAPARRRLAELPRTHRFATPAEAGEWLRVRRPALLGAARLAVEAGGGELDTLARRLVSALIRCFEVHGAAEEAGPEIYRLHELVLRVAERGGRHRERAAALLHLARMDVAADRLPHALTRFRTALDAAHAAGDEHAAVRALESLGGAYAELGDWDRSADWYGRALQLRLSRGEPAAVAALHGRLGAVLLHAGEWGGAARAWRAASSVYRRMRDGARQARALAELARVQEYAGRDEEAVRTCREALVLAERAGAGRLRAALLLRLADGCERLGDVREAGGHRRRAEQLLADLGAGRVVDTEGDATGATCESNSAIDQI